MVQSGRAPDPAISPAAGSPGGGSGPTTEAAEKPADGRAGGERMDAADEGRRARLRQVRPCQLIQAHGLVADVHRYGKRDGHTDMLVHSPIGR